MHRDIGRHHGGPQPVIPRRGLGMPSQPQPVVSGKPLDPRRSRVPRQASHRPLNPRRRQRLQNLRVLARMNNLTRTREVRRPSEAHSTWRPARTVSRSAGRLRSGPLVRSATTNTSPRPAALDRNAASRSASRIRTVPPASARPSTPPRRSAPSSSSSTLTDPRTTCPFPSSRFRSSPHNGMSDEAVRYSRGSGFTPSCASAGSARPSGRAWSPRSSRHCA
jgi:hypothetical protein